MKEKRKISVLERAKCTGCGACENICPVNAIGMKENSEGFLYPEIAADRCVNCGLCAARCPVLNPKYKNKKNPECRAIWAKDEIRMQAASGGIFTAFAEKILQGGGAVCGAAYEEDLSVSMLVASDRAGLDKIRNSKYMQSRTGLAYRQIKKLLLQGKEVLFGGCPCQVAGLYAYLGESYPKLYTMDIICHGVPSVKVFKKYADDTYGKDNVVKVDFRAKDVFGWSTEMTVTLRDGRVVRTNHAQDSFYRAFLPCMALRKSCATCAFSRLPRQGDLTIGDFWGIDRYKKELNDRKGTSAVLVNNAKGAYILKSCRDIWGVNEKVPLEYATHINKTIEHPFTPHPARRRFFENLDTTDFRKLVNDCSSHHYDVGIVGLWYGLNYGSILTYYALNRVITDMGYQCLMLNKPNGLWTDRYLDKNSLANRFIYKHCYVANVNPNREDLFRLNNHCNTFVVGSDVVWNYLICGREAGHYFYLDFVLPTKKKIAYASSFGDYKRGSDEYEALARYYLKSFDAISVREEASVDYVQEHFGLEAANVLDPVFLCEHTHYERLISESKLKENQEFFATYFLEPMPVKKNAILTIQRCLGLEYRNLSNPNRSTDELEKQFQIELLRDVSVEDWLYYMSHCKFYIGDSFHGLCFAIIFRKPFIVFVDRNLPSLGRFESLLHQAGLQDRMLFLDAPESELERVAQTPIDYDAVGERLSPYIRYSESWLQEKLQEKKPDAGFRVSTENRSLAELYYEILMSRLAERDREIEELKKLVRNLHGDGNTLPFAQTVEEYLQALKANRQRCIYLVAVKDTPGLSVTEEMSKALRENLGLRTDMAKKHWKSFLAVIDGGKLVYEEISDGKLEKDMQRSGFHIHLESAALNVGNIAKISVNEKDFAMNRRGFNIVAIDKEDGRVCDSSYLDLHLKQYVFAHKDLF